MRSAMTLDRRPAPDSRRPAWLLADERGATAIEYALMACLLAVLVVGALQVLGGATGSLYGAMEEITTVLEDARRVKPAAGSADPPKRPRGLLRGLGPGDPVLAGRYSRSPARASAPAGCAWGADRLLLQPVGSSARTGALGNSNPQV
jgi:Flp pilus assembly pilin Flp